MKNSSQNIKAIGLMSGTSCDGLDIAYCEFNRLEESWSYRIIAAETISYDALLLSKLKTAANMSGLELMTLDRDFGKYCGMAVLSFLKKHRLGNPEVIGSHGHTVFHTPSTGLSYQLGSGASLYGTCTIPVACDFRSIDVALGGQGAPLVPLGDKLLFSQYDYCLNLGGISNISFSANGKTMGFDICPVNMVLNFLSNKLGFEYDKDGAIAASGIVDTSLLKQLNELDFYKEQGPKSLGKEWFDSSFLPLIESYLSLGIPVLLATCVEHIAEQMSITVRRHKKENARLLATGGGAFNKYLMKLFAKKLMGDCAVELVDEQTIAFKEALIFALLGSLRMLHEDNVLCSSTGSLKDHCGGALYGC
jgi:anhydro-N-acetylmuramic acid kinase